MTPPLTQEERQAQERARIQDEAGRLFGLIVPKKPESDRWLYDRLVKSARHWADLEDDRHYELCASNVLHSGRVRENRTTPYLFCFGPDGTGKGRIGHWHKVLCQRGLLVVSPKPANLFWTIERHHPTLIIDEGEKLAPRHRNSSELSEALIEILNAGYQQDELIPRIDSEARILKFYDPFGFKVILSTEDIPRTLKRRCVVINTEENINPDIPVSHPTVNDLGIKELRQYLEYYWGQYETGSVWHKDPEPILSLEDLKLLMGSHNATEKFGPLYRVTPDPLAQKHILELANEDSNDRREERGVSMEAQILQALAMIRQARPGEDRYKTADIANLYNDGREKYETLSSDSIGRKVHKFGLRDCRIDGKRAIVWNEAKLVRRFRRYGIEALQVVPSGKVASHIATSDTSYTRDQETVDEWTGNPPLLHPKVKRGLAATIEMPLTIKNLCNGCYRGKRYESFNGVRRIGSPTSTSCEDCGSPAELQVGIPQ